MKRFFELNFVCCLWLVLDCKSQGNAHGMELIMNIVVLVVGNVKIHFSSLQTITRLQPSSKPNAINFGYFHWLAILVLTFRHSLDLFNKTFLLGHYWLDLCLKIQCPEVQTPVTGVREDTG